MKDGMLRDSQFPVIQLASLLLPRLALLEPNGMPLNDWELGISQYPIMNHILTIKNHPLK
jgi:hypothetical protein